MIAQEEDALQKTKEGQVISGSLIGGSIIVLLFVMSAIAIVVLKVKSTQRRKALEYLSERNYCGLALVRYVMLNRQCSEEVAYQHLARFVKKHVPLDEQSSIDRMLALDRQSLIDRTQSILVHDPDEIDKI